MCFCYYATTLTFFSSSSSLASSALSCWRILHRISTFAKPGGTSGCRLLAQKIWTPWLSAQRSPTRSGCLILSSLTKRARIFTPPRQTTPSCESKQEAISCGRSGECNIIGLKLILDIIACTCMHHTLNRPFVYHSLLYQRKPKNELRKLYTYQGYQRYHVNVLVPIKVSFVYIL